MYDLLAPQPFLERPDAPMTIGEDENGVYVKGLSSHLAQNEEEALNFLFEVSFMQFRSSFPLFESASFGESFI